MTETKLAPQLNVEEWKLGVIKTNLNELEAYVNDSLKKYQDLVYTDDQIKDAKIDRRNLNNLGKAINDWRIQKEREFNAPFAEVKEQCNRVVGRIEETSGKINSQVKAYEEEQKRKKKEQIAAYWDEIKIHDIPLDMIFDSKWLNVTCSEKEWKAALNQRKERISMDLASFANYADAKMCEFMITEYMKTLDVQKCLDRWNEQIEAERRAEEAKARAEAVRLAREEETRRRAEMAAQRAAEEAARPAPQEDPAPARDDPRDFLYTRVFKCIDMTYEQIYSLNDFLKKNRITFEVDRDKKSQRRK